MFGPRLEDLDNCYDSKWVIVESAKPKTRKKVKLQYKIVLSDTASDLMGFFIRVEDEWITYKKYKTVRDATKAMTTLRYDSLFHNSEIVSCDWRIK